MRNKRLYNFLTNTYGLSKENVMLIMEERFNNLELKVKAIVEQKITELIQGYDMQVFLRNQISNILQNGISTDHWSRTKHTIHDYIKSEVSKIIEEYVKEKINNDFVIKIETKKEK